jgi:hypothetical protein
MKFLVLGQFDLAGLRAEVIPAISRKPQYAEKLLEDKRLLARCEVRPLAEMEDPTRVMRPTE